MWGLESRTSRSRLLWQSLGLEVWARSRSRLHHWPTGSDGVSRHGLGLTLFCESRSRRFHLGLEGYRSRSQAYCPETLNIAWICRTKTSVIQWVSSLLICKKETTKTGRKTVRKSKKIELGSGDDIFFKTFRQTSQILKSGLSVLNLKSRISLSEFLIKSRSRRFWSHIQHCFDF